MRDFGIRTTSINLKKISTNFAQFFVVVIKELVLNRAYGKHIEKWRICGGMREVQELHNRNFPSSQPFYNYFSNWHKLTQHRAGNCSLSGEIQKTTAYYIAIVAAKIGKRLSWKIKKPGGGVLPYNEGDRQKFWKVPLKCTKITFCGCGSNSFSSLRGTNSKPKLVPVIFFRFHTLKGTRITRTVVILDLKTLSGTKPRILTLKRYD